MAVRMRRSWPCCARSDPLIVSKLSLMKNCGRRPACGDSSTLGADALRALRQVPSLRIGGGSGTGLPGTACREEGLPQRGLLFRHYVRADGHPARYLYLDFCHGARLRLAGALAGTDEGEQALPSRPDL